jgi:hypothetical protein
MCKSLSASNYEKAKGIDVTNVGPSLRIMKGAGDHPVPEIAPEIEFGTDVANAEGLVLNVSLRNVFFGAHCIQKPALLALQYSFASWLQN